MIQDHSLRVPALAVFVLFTCCAKQAAAGPHHEDTHVQAHWSYEGATGPEHWSTLSPDYALCGTGTRQSPIDLGESKSLDLKNLEFHYQSGALEIVNNGHTVQVDCAPGSHVDIDGVRYDLQQFHFHAPSEHTIAGKHASAELHLVHKSATGALAVVGVLIQEGEANARFDPVFDNLPKQAGPAQHPAAKINAADLLPEDPRTYRYVGSLTTPPGTEDVHWYVMVEPVHLSKAQIAAFTQLYHDNNRPPQPRNGRAVEQDSTR